MPCTCTGTASGHAPPNSDTGTHASSSTAPFAPARVWASICAGRTPSEIPAYTTPGSYPSATWAPRSRTVSNPISCTCATPSSTDANVRPSNRSGRCTVFPAARSDVAICSTPSVSPRAWWNSTTSAMSPPSALGRRPAGRRCPPGRDTIVVRSSHIRPREARDGHVGTFVRGATDLLQDGRTGRAVCSVSSVARMTTPPPVDATSTASWAALTAHRDALDPDLRGWFAADPQRADRLTHQAGDLTVDLSKNLVTDETLELLVRLADEVGLGGRLEAMFRGDHMHVTEDRAVLHTALRRPAPLGDDEHLVVDGQDVDADVHGEIAKVYAFEDTVRSGGWTGVTGERVRTVVNIGIGGSDLGPVMAYEALLPYKHADIDVRFVSNIDPTDVAEKTAGLARDWLWTELVALGAIEDTDEARRDAVSKHSVAVSTALDKVAAFGIDPEN